MPVCRQKPTNARNHQLAISERWPDEAALRHVTRGEFVLEFILSFLVGHPSVFPRSKGYRPRSSGPPTAGRRAQTKTATAKTESLGPTLLERSSPLLVPLD